MTDTDDQSALIAGLEAQERQLVFTHFTNDDAWTIGARLVEIGRARSLPVTIDIRRHGHQLFHVALAGTAPDNDHWIQRKINVVNRFGESSFLVGRRLAAAGDALDTDRGIDPMEFAAHGGAVPIRIADVGVVGTVTVSGLPQAADHALVVEVLSEFLIG